MRLGVRIEFGSYPRVGFTYEDPFFASMVTDLLLWDLSLSVHESMISTLFIHIAWLRFSQSLDAVCLELS